jgi:hypothetical protein
MHPVEMVFSRVREVYILITFDYGQRFIDYVHANVHKH